MNKLWFDSICILLLVLSVSFMLWAFWNFCKASGRRKSRFPSVSLQAPSNATQDWRSSVAAARLSPRQTALDSIPLRTATR